MPIAKRRTVASDTYSSNLFHSIDLARIATEPIKEEEESKPVTSTPISSIAESPPVCIDIKASVDKITSVQVLEQIMIQVFKCSLEEIRLDPFKLSLAILRFVMISKNVRNLLFANKTIAYRDSNVIKIRLGDKKLQSIER